MKTLLIFLGCAVYGVIATVLLTNWNAPWYAWVGMIGIVPFICGFKASSMGWV